MEKSLLILTGHSKGLGRALMDFYLNKTEFQVLAVSRTTLGISHPNLTEISLDLGDLEVLETKLPDIFPKDEFKEIILINNAGVIGEIKPIGKLDPKKLRNSVNVNLLAPMYITNAFKDAYRDSAALKMVCNISSGAASKPVSGWGGYCSTKAALAMFTMVASKESSTPNFKFYSLAPGIVDTEMQGDIRNAESSDFPEIEKFRGYKENGNLSTPEEVAEKIATMLSQSHKYLEVVQDVRNFD